MSKELTSKDRILAAIAGREVDRPPICPSFLRWMRGHAGCTCETHQLKMHEKFGFDPFIEYGMYLNHPISSDYVYRPDADGGYRDLPNVNVNIRVENHNNRTTHIRKFETPDGILTDRIEWHRPNKGYGDGPNPVRAEPLVKTTDDVGALRHLYPQPRKGFTDDLRLFTELIGNRGVVAFNESSTAWALEALGDAEKQLIWGIDNKDLIKAVLRTAQDQHLRNLKTVLESGHKLIEVSWFQYSTTIGWSPAHLEEFFAPLIKESVKLVKSYDGIYRYQNDGAMAKTIPFLIESGVDIIGALQPPPTGDCVIGEIKDKYGDRVCLLGGLDPIYTFELGTPEIVNKATNEYLNQIGDGTGIIICTGEAFGPETPAECLHELVRTVRKWSNERSLSPS